MRSISNRSSFMNTPSGAKSAVARKREGGRSPAEAFGEGGADYISQWMRDDPSIPRFVRVPAGEFSMGSDDGAEDERPRHKVHVDAYYVSVHPITVDQYAEFAKETGHGVPGVRDLPLLVTPTQESSFRDLAAPYIWRGGDPPRDRAKHPVTLVTHGDATAYCRWLSGRIGRLVRLPTEAEWERAARGDLERARYPWGDDVDTSRANFLPDPALKRHRGTRPVGCYPPNTLQLYDMAGNVWQWVADWYRDRKSTRLN